MEMLGKKLEFIWWKLPSQKVCLRMLRKPGGILERHGRRGRAYIKDIFKIHITHSVPKYKMF
jgi:hypothetical protein